MNTEIPQDYESRIPSDAYEPEPDERTRLRMALRRRLRDNGKPWHTWTITATDIDAAFDEVSDSGHPQVPNGLASEKGPVGP